MRFKVVVIDDKPLIRRSLIETIQWEVLGCEIAGEAENGLEAAKENGLVSSVELGIRRMCSLLEKAGAKQPCYVYEFGPEIPGEDNPGAFHSSDLWFFFETLAKCWRPFTGKHYDLARQMCNYWAEFMKKGDPNGADADGTPMEKWEAFLEEKPAVMTFFDSPRAQVKPEDEVTAFLMDVTTRG